MSNKNNVTGDTIITKYSEAYSDNYDAIFRKEKPVDVKTGVEYDPDEDLTELLAKDGVKMTRLKKLLERPEFQTRIE